MKSSRLRPVRGAVVLVAAALVLALAQLALTRTAAADPRERLFATGTLDSLPAGALLAFSRERSVPESATIERIEDGALTIRIAGDDGPSEARVRFDQPGREVVMPPSPTSAAHPALLVFLETTVDDLAKLTGGSPHYIKNRFIEAFGEPETVEPIEIEFADEGVAAEKLLFQPFADDPHADQLGSLADLELVFVLSEAVPGELHAASATGGAYRHKLALEETEEVR